MANTYAGGEEADTGEFVWQLLGRVRNADGLGQEVLRRLATALMHHTELHTLRECKGPPRSMSRRTFRHSFLLANGSSQVLWEIKHDTGDDSRMAHQVYADPEALERAEAILDSLIGGPPPGWPGDDVLESLWASALLAEAPSEGRTYTEDQSADHAERVLRRAENEDAPGEDVRQRLRSAFAHQIVFVTRRHSHAHGREVGWTLYEHAFLLSDGKELSLWELEHTMAPDGLPVCEVYADQAAACEAADLRLEAW